jgi:hypothetical protein
MVYPALLPLMRTPRMPIVNWIDAPADLNGLVRFAERRNLVSAHAPSHFKRGLTVYLEGIYGMRAAWDGYSSGEGIWLRNYYLCQGIYHCVSSEFSSGQCFWDWYFSLTSPAIKLVDSVLYKISTTNSISPLYEICTSNKNKHSTYIYRSRLRYVVAEFIAWWKYPAAW